MPIQTSVKLPRLWDTAHAQKLDPVDLLVYASNLLGSDPRITNFGGGNTSAKVSMPDPLSGQMREVLWVKGSGGDLGSAKRSSFASLYMDRFMDIVGLYQRGTESEDSAVALYAQATFGQNPAAASIDTPLHGLIPHAAVSHLHSDAIIAIAASKDAKELTQKVFGGRLAFLPWKRPGLALGVQLKELYDSHPGIDGAIMESHGYICWADDWERCYELSLELIDLAQGYIDSKISAHPFGSRIREPRHESSEGLLRRLLPIVRGLAMHDGLRLIANTNASEPVLEFLAREKSAQLIPLGTSCPDHFLRTKIRPLVLDAEDSAKAIAEKMSHFRKEYDAYYERCKVKDSPPLRNPNPSIVLIPGVGMISLGKNAQEARVTGEFYRNAIAVMHGAEAVSSYVALPEQEAFNIEYWLLEEAKLRRMPAEREFSRTVTVVTGGAQGIGRATAMRIAREGGCVALFDIAEDRLMQTQLEIDQIAANKDSVLAVRCDVTDTSQLHESFGRVVDRFGGLDLLVVSAGNARRGTVIDTSAEDFEFMEKLLIKAYFDSISEACKIMIDQGTGGAIVVVASKNGTAVGQNAAMYSAAKAFELHLMRTVAADMAKYGIRCNAINPDAVLEGSGIWNDKWRNETAALLGIPPEELQEHYKKRTMLGRTVSADDCAEAIAWLLDEARSSRTTGCVIPVDGGIREGFLR